MSTSLKLLSLVSLLLSTTASPLPFLNPGSLGERSAADGVAPAFLERSLEYNSLVKRLDYSPPITSPTADTVWTAGETVTISW